MTSPNLIIAGGGLAGSIAALALAEWRPDVSFLLVEHGQSFGGNHIWSFFDGDVDAAERGLIDPLVTRRWPDHQVQFPMRRRTLGFGYNSVRSADLDRVVRQRLRPDQVRLGQPVAELGPGHVTLAGGERIAAGAVIDARGPGPMPGLELGWQKFVGRTYRFDRPHGRTRPMIMDATVAQEDGYRFLYALPFSDTQLLLEDTYYSASPALDIERLRGGLDAIADGIAPWTMVGEETGLLPVLLDGELDALWPTDAAPIARLGLRGGFFHPTTGYSLPDAVRNAALLCAQRELSGPAVHALLRGRAAELWEERSFFKLLNRMLFHAAEPALRYRVLEHFYRLPEPVIARFYAARLTALDKLRILSGRPPVSISRAWSAMRGKAA